MLENENISSEKSAESAVENSAGITAIRKVTMEDAIEAENIISTLMGENAEVRRQFIEENAKLVEELDV